MYDELTCDFLIVGSGGAGLMAALHAYDADPRLRIVLVSKGLIGKSGCTRLVQGGFNAALDPRDSVELHFADTLKAGQFLNNQDLVWELVNGAPRAIAELETKVGCFFDRRDDGVIHQKPFAGQSFDRTVHRGDLTGIEIVSRLHDQLFARAITLLDETRAVALVPAVAGRQVAGALLLNQRTGRFVLVRARLVLLCTGGGPRMYRVCAPSVEKTGDGYAMAYRAGCDLIDMEMMQFHPTGILAGASRLTGMVLEEGLRGVGGRLTNALGERYMSRYDPERLERSTRDVVARANYLEIVEGRGTPSGGVYLDVSHLGADFVARNFPGMVRRCTEVGYDLTRAPVEVTPTAHFHMGGVRIEPDCQTDMAGLLVAGEDAGGVHGANRLGGNGVAESIVFGSLAGDTAARLCRVRDLALPDEALVEQTVTDVLAPLGRTRGENPFKLREAIQNLMWEHVGLVRDGSGLDLAIAALQEIEERADALTAPGGREWNLTWQETINVKNLIVAARLTSQAARYRRESRGSHYRRDLPERDDRRWLVNVHQRREARVEQIWETPVALTRVRPQLPEGIR